MNITIFPRCLKKWSHVKYKICSVYKVFKHGSVNLSQEIALPLWRECLQIWVSSARNKVSRLKGNKVRMWTEPAVLYNKYSYTLQSIFWVSVAVLDSACIHRASQNVILIIILEQRRKKLHFYTWRNLENLGNVSKVTELIRGGTGISAQSV